MFRLDSRKPKHEGLVLVKVIVKDKEYLMFRQFLDNAGQEYFSAFNPAFEKIMNFDDYEVIGYFSYQIIR